MKKIRDIFSTNEGFTLIELLIVIVIIGVLAAIAVPNIAGLYDSADEEVVRANMRTLLTEIEARKASSNTDNIASLNGYVELQQMEDDAKITLTDIGDSTTDDNYVITASGGTGDDAFSFTIDDGQLIVGNGGGSENEDGEG